MKRLLGTAIAALALIISAAPANSTSSTEAAQDATLTDSAHQRNISYDQMAADYSQREAVNVVLDATYRLPGYAGAQSIWIEGGGFAFNFFYADAETLNAARAAAPAGVTVNYQQVKYSRSDLVGIQKDILANYSDSDVYYVSWDVQNNRDIVYTSETVKPEIASRLTAEYGDKVTTAIGQQSTGVACNNTNDPDGGSRRSCIPMRAGIELLQPNGIDKCTMTMWAKGNSDGSHKIITAAHCVDPTDDTVDFTHSGSQIGTSAKSSGTLAFPISDSRKTPPNTWTWDGSTTIFNKLYYNATTPTYDITDEKPIENIAADDLVCKDGMGSLQYTTGTWCGGVITPDSSWPFPGLSSKSLGGMQADFNGSFGSIANGNKYGVSGGDSGAPVFYNHKIWGLASTINGQVSYWDGIESDLNVTFCQTAAC